MNNTCSRGWRYTSFWWSLWWSEEFCHCVDFAGFFFTFSFLKLAEACYAWLRLGLLLSAGISFLFLSLQPGNVNDSCNIWQVDRRGAPVQKCQTSQPEPSLLEFAFVFLFDSPLSSTLSRGLAKPGSHKSRILSCTAALTGPRGLRVADWSSWSASGDSAEGKHVWMMTPPVRAYYFNNLKCIEETRTVIYTLQVKLVLSSKQLPNIFFDGQDSTLGCKNQHKHEYLSTSTK